MKLCVKHLTPEYASVCGDDRCVIDGKPTGAVRASFGYMSTRRDADALVTFVAKYFVDRAAPAPCPALASTCAAVAEQGSMSVGEGVCVQAGTGRSKAADSSEGCAVSLEFQGVPHASRLAGADGETKDVGEAGCGGLRHATMAHDDDDAAAAAAADAPWPSMLGQNGVRGNDETTCGAEERDGDVAAHMAAEDVAERQAKVVAERSAEKQRPLQVEQSDAEGRGAEEGAGGVENGEVLAEGEVQEIYIYPIKSCAAHACLGAGGWPLTSTGLLYDRCVYAHARVQARTRSDTRTTACAHAWPTCAHAQS